MSIQVGAHNTHEIINHLTVAPSLSNETTALHWIAVALGEKWIHIDLRELGIFKAISWPLKEDFKSNLTQLTRSYVIEYSLKEEMSHIAVSIKMIFSNLINTSGTEKVLVAARQEIENIKTKSNRISITCNLDDDLQNRLTLLEGLLMDMDAYSHNDKDYMQSPLRSKVLSALPEI